MMAPSSPASRPSPTGGLRPALTPTQGDARSNPADVGQQKRRKPQIRSLRFQGIAEADIAKIADAYHTWRNRDGGCEDVPGFVKAATLDEIKKHAFVLTPDRYVDAQEAEPDDEPIETKIARLTAAVFKEFDRGREFEAEIRSRIEGLRHV